MSRPARRALAPLAVAALADSGPALAHVPYIEGTDYSRAAPFVLKRVADTKAIYGWLQAPDDVDVASIDLAAPASIVAEVDVQVCPAPAGFLPSYAIVGPGLPRPPRHCR